MNTKLLCILLWLPALFMGAEDRVEPPVVVAVVETAVLNEKNLIGGQRPTGTVPIYRVQFNIIEVLRGPQELLGKQFFSLSTEHLYGFEHFNLIIPNLEIGQEGLFGLYKESDGLWYDIGVGGPFDAKDSWLAHPRLLKSRDPKYEGIVNGLRDRRDHPKAYNVAESKNGVSVTAPQVQPAPHIPQPKPVPSAKPAAAVPEKAEQTHLGLWLTGIVAAITISFLIFRKEKRR